ncbi:hypothetical protein I553_6270 [Mycobacterium xenopi 4042]|uniref:Uncharacterized protein n=1 Tax=Mycobacterium xenopi 4042 TaxID=1299334 RepID=X8BH71_MYCXE|nr:hypothetical protein I552_6507 [Mycobacterium xenopi 3993]EUA42410.1 hypothetical protein I553_6270 [Mycobacterium xenopi 4042]
MPPGSPTQTPPGPKTVIDHDGTFAVGTDILPGTYTSAGPVQGRTCYWKRTNGSDIIDNAMTKKPQVVQIEPTDKAFKTDGCQPWQKNDAATVDPGKSPQKPKSSWTSSTALPASTARINHPSPDYGRLHPITRTLNVAIFGGCGRSATPRPRWSPLRPLGRRR